MIDTKKEREWWGGYEPDSIGMRRLEGVFAEVDRLRAEVATSRRERDAAVTHWSQAEARAQALTEALRALADSWESIARGIAESASWAPLSAPREVRDDVYRECASAARALLANPDASAERFYSEREIEAAVLGTFGPDAEDGTPSDCERLFATLRGAR